MKGRKEDHRTESVAISARGKEAPSRRQTRGRLRALTMSVEDRLKKLEQIVKVQGTLLIRQDKDMGFLKADKNVVVFFSGALKDNVLTAMKEDKERKEKIAARPPATPGAAGAAAASGGPMASMEVEGEELMKEKAIYLPHTVYHLMIDYIIEMVKDWADGKEGPQKAKTNDQARELKSLDTQMVIKAAYPHSPAPVEGRLSWAWTFTYAATESGMKGREIILNELGLVLKKSQLGVKADRPQEDGGKLVNELRTMLNLPQPKRRPGAPKKRAPEEEGQGPSKR